MIEYTNMRGGDYTLTIYAVDDRGRETEPIEIAITKPLKAYERPWVLIIGAIMCIVSAVAITRIVLNRRMKVIRKESTWRKQVTLDSIEALAHTIDAKDVYTKGHSIRVAKMSVCIARKMNMTEEELEIIYYIGLMHDVGKVGIPDRILNKPGRLTDEEYSIMKEHPEIGHLILQSIKSIPHLEDGVDYHHEKFDGSGYPKGLKGEEIPLIGRVICCADCYDAMATKRCYKEAGLSDEVIIAELQRCSGTHFDPVVVKYCIEGPADKILDRELSDQS